MSQGNITHLFLQQVGCYHIAYMLNVMAEWLFGLKLCHRSSIVQLDLLVLLGVPRVDKKYNLVIPYIIHIDRPVIKLYSVFYILCLCSTLLLFTETVSNLSAISWSPSGTVTLNRVFPIMLLCHGGYLEFLIHIIKMLTF